MIEQPINVTLPATGETPVLVELNASVGCSDHAIQARGDVDMLISNVNTIPASGTYWTVKSGTAQSLAGIMGPGASLFYAVSSGAADTIEVLPKRI